MSTPDTFNTWLKNNKGYDGSNDLEEDAVPALNPTHIQWSDSSGMHTTNDVPLATIQQRIKTRERGLHMYSRPSEGFHRMQSDLRLLGC